jgi:S1/P1 Nuclease
MSGWQSPKRLLLACILLGIALTSPHPARAWGDEGHKVIALIAEHYLDPAARAKVAGLLAADADTLTDHEIASEATWADKYRDSDRSTTKIRYDATWRWHFVDIELTQPDLAAACFGHPPLPPGVPASKGPPQACVVDKINQFAAELSDRAISASEQLLALKFLLHFVGDLHQPLHAADNHDAGGNKKLVAGEGLRPSNLHHYWDVEFVERLGTDPRQVAGSLIGQISEEQRQAWSSGTPADWAMEAFALARRDAYGLLTPPGDHGTYSLPPAYGEQAEQDVALQLSRAGVRLAFVLNQALARTAN